ncbi:MAG: DNA polymerase III subunit beta [Kiritimatiellae bacterium]|nr:DNA polymerase III subunit beta [Kiritimatiellia bacterium]
MKFTIARAKLLDALQKVQNVVAARSTLQILANCMIRAEGGKLTITTTDLDISVRCEVEARDIQEGATTLPVRRLVGIVRELPEQDIEMNVSEEDQASVQCGSTFFKIVGLPMRDFPPVPAAEGSACYRIDSGAFREMLRKTSYAVSLDETRRVLTGVLLAFKEGKLTMVATDGRRLALVEHEVEFPPEAEAELILPSKAVNELMHILREDGDLSIYAQKGQAVFSSGEATLSTKLVDGVYPNYRQVIPTGCDERVVVMREELLTALRRVSLVTTDKSNATKLTFNNNQLTVSTQTPEIGEARESLPIKYGGKEISVIFNPEYVMDPLRNLDSDEIFIEMSNGHSPALVKCNLPFLYVLMPLRVN